MKTVYVSTVLQHHRNVCVQHVCCMSAVWPRRREINALNVSRSEVKGVKTDRNLLRFYELSVAATFLHKFCFFLTCLTSFWSGDQVRGAELYKHNDKDVTVSQVSSVTPESNFNWFYNQLNVPGEPSTVFLTLNFMTFDPCSPVKLFWWNISDILIDSNHSGGQVHGVRGHKGATQN